MSTHHDDEEGVVFKPQALDIVKDWVPDVLHEVTREESVPEARPSRVGIGAKFVSHNQIQGAADKIKSKIQKRKRDEEDNDNVEGEETDDDVDESRAALIRKKTMEGVGGAQLEGAKKKKVKAAKSSKVEDSSNTVKSDDHGIEGDDTGIQKPKRHRKKTRSRQKNIRKDNRNMSDRPSSLRPGSKAYQGRPMTPATKSALGIEKTETRKQARRANRVAEVEVNQSGSEKSTAVAATCSTTRSGTVNGEEVPKVGAQKKEVKGKKKRSKYKNLITAGEEVATRFKRTASAGGTRAGQQREGGVSLGDGVFMSLDSQGARVSSLSS